MGLVSLLFSFQGRIGRLQYWLGNLALFLLGVFAFVLVGAQMRHALYLGKATPETMNALAASSMLAAPIWAVMSWSGYAIQVKRFHDRGRTGYLCLVPIVLMFFVIYTLFSKMAENASAPAVIAALMPPIGLIWLVGLWFFIDLGCLRGVEGPNKYSNPPGTAPSTPISPTPTKTAPVNAATTSALFGAQSALDRAIAEQANQRAQARPAPASPPAAASPAGAAFGRRSAT